MAIYHFSASVMSRGKGHCSVAAAAYRASEKLYDERLDQTHDFTRKSDVVHSEILLPDGGPEWMQDREKLWNAVEKKERRKDAQLAREITISLPKELTREQNWALAKAFVQQEFVDRGMVADMNFHRGHKGREEQPHVHIMLSMRAVNAKGFGQKNRAWNKTQLLESWRENWALACNRELVRQGHDMKIDHRTLEAQGIDLEPQSKIGPAISSEAMARFAEHQALAKRNGERLLADPTIGLYALTQQQSTFTHQDMARLVNRQSVDSAQFQAVYQAMTAHPELVKLGVDDQGRDRYTTQTMLTLERELARLADKQGDLAQHRASSVAVHQAMATRTLSDEQQQALRHLTQGKDLACVMGMAGTGKSYLLGAAREAWEQSGYRVQGMTLSGIAADNLAGSAGIESHTVANRLLCWANDRARLTSRDIVVVDEAGMLGSEQMVGILKAVDHAQAKLVLVGDTEQLQAIAAGAAYRAIAERVGFVELSEIRRQQVAWQRTATQDLARQRTATALLAYDGQGCVHQFATRQVALTSMVERWDEARSQTPEQSQIMLAYTRQDVLSLNLAARTMRQAQGELGNDYVCETPRGPRHFAVGDRLYFLRNDNDLAVKNGTLGTLEAVNADQLTVRPDGRDRPVNVPLKDYNALDYGYAATIHKAQGITVDRSYVLASRYLDRHATYVAMSRHRLSAELYYGKDDFPTFGALGRTLSRERTQDMTLDYANSHGVEVPEARQHRDRQNPLTHPPLTPERAEAAQQRITARRERFAFQADLQQAEKHLDVSLQPAQIGDEGAYCGTITLREREDGVIQVDDGQARYLPADQLLSRQKGEQMAIQATRTAQGTLQRQGRQPEVERVQQAQQQRQRERTRERDRGVEIGDGWGL